MKKYRLLTWVLICSILLGVFSSCTSERVGSDDEKDTSDKFLGSVIESSDTSFEVVNTTVETEDTITESSESVAITETTVTETETTVTETETTVTETETTVTESETTVTESETTVTESETTVTESETTVTESETTVTETDTTVTETETTVTETDTTETETETTVTETDTTETETETTVTEAETQFRDQISKSRSEMEEMYDLDDEDFEELEAMLEEFLEYGINGDANQCLELDYLVYEKFIYIDTMINVAMIIYDLDRSDDAAYETYFDAYSKRMAIYDRYMEIYMELYEKSPHKDIIFASWSSGDIEMLLGYDPEIQSLMLENEQILDEINNFSQDDLYENTPELFAQMVVNRNAIAKYYGYENYYEYASQVSYGRDYSVEDTERFVQYVIDYYASNLLLIENLFWNKYNSLSNKERNMFLSLLDDPFDALDKNYLLGYIESFDGSTKDGFMHMIENRNMVFSESEYSHQSAYQIYLDHYGTSFCLFGSDGQSVSTIVHEMGHYYAGLYSMGFSNLDIAETQSQSNELLFIDYLKDEIDEDVYMVYKLYTLYDSVQMGIVCAIVDEFERRIYFLDSEEEIMNADFDRIMDEVCMDFGVSGIGDMYYYWRVVCTNTPAYYITYAVSMAASMSVLSAVEIDSDAGREMYRQICEETLPTESFSQLLQRVGLSSPFEEQCFIDIITMIFSEDDGIEPNWPTEGEEDIVPAA